MIIHNKDVTIKGIDGTLWIIVPKDEHKENTRYRINRQYRNGIIVVEEREYVSFREAVTEVHRQKDRSDKEAFHRAIRTESLCKSRERQRFINEASKVDKGKKKKYNANISDRS